MAAKPALSPRKRNKDGSRDPVCLTCFTTFGGCMPEGQFPDHDKHTVCDSAFLAERGLLTRAESRRHPPASTRPGMHAA
jgi:hypothetical protein